MSTTFRSISLNFSNKRLAVRRQRSRRPCCLRARHNLCSFEIRSDKERHSIVNTQLISFDLFWISSYWQFDFEVAMKLIISQVCVEGAALLRTWLDIPKPFINIALGSIKIPKKMFISEPIRPAHIRLCPRNSALAIGTLK